MPTRSVFSGSNVEVELDYDNANRVTAVRVINQNNQAAYVEVARIDNGRKVGQIFLAGTTTEISVGTGAAQRIEQFQNERGFWDGLDIRVLIPPP